MKRLTHFPDIDIQRNEKAYDLYINTFRMNDGWHAGNKEFNFNAMMKLMDLTGISLTDRSCLDVGCGTGDFSAFLRKRGIKKYTGIDIYKPSLAEAKKKYPKEEFILGDFLAGDVEGMFDYAFCSGSMTLKLAKEDNYDFLYSIVAKMWKQTKIGLVFNVLTDEQVAPDPDLFFYNPEKVQKICRSIDTDAEIVIEPTRHVAQIHAYMYRK